MTVYQLVEGVGREPFPYGIFSVLTPREGDSDRWRDGVTWRTDPCEPLTGTAAGCGTQFSDSGTTADAPWLKEAIPAWGSAEATPFLAISRLRCNLVGTSMEEMQAAAQARLEVREQTLVERALETGAFGNVPFLGQSPTVLGTVSAADREALRNGLGALEGYLAAVYGGLGVIHVSRGTAVRMGNDLVTNGGRAFTRVGTPVVIGSGYSATSMWATPALFGYRDTASFSMTRAQPHAGFNRENNAYDAIMERGYLIGYDDCGVAQVRITDTLEGS